MKYPLISIIIIVLFSGCVKESSTQNMSLEVSSVIENLKVTLTISATNTDGAVDNIEVKWGDENVNNLNDIDFTKFELAHIYSVPGDYSIDVIARSNKGDSVLKSNTVTVSAEEPLIENMKPNLFKLSDNEYLILTINLHTYQEPEQEEKFDMIVDLIGKMDVDFIAFQECAQNKSSAISEGIIREDNMALVISNRLKEKYNVDYNYVWNWAHYGWNVWEEGIAVLSKHELIDTDEKYISTNTSTGDITSRKVIYGSYQMPKGKINIFSAHTHWRTSETDEEQSNQIKNIKLMVDEKESITSDVFTFVCGDFNVNPTSDYPWSEGYNIMVKNNDYVDSFLEIYTNANNKPAQSIYNTIGGDYPGRIDYIFMKDNTRYEVLESQIVFTNDVVGKVSDHFGVLTKVIDNE